MINGYCFKDAVISGANNILNHKDMVDALNIFPVPDGDTGTNMSMTISTVFDNVTNSDNIGEVSKSIASHMLRGARGNSGVILSVLFKGFAEGLKGLNEVSGQDLVKALELGVDKAYETVSKPTEGTILTVARMAFEQGQIMALTDNDPITVWADICKGAEQALEMTPELLPVLKKANVVDAGGKGLCLIFEGMLSVFRDSKIILKDDAKQEESYKRSDSIFGDMAIELDKDINFTYCTEFIVSNGEDKSIGINELGQFLEGIGDSIIVVDDDDIVKVHVHTDAPGLVLQEGLKIGQILTVKIENMRQQNKEALGKDSGDKKDSDAKRVQEFKFAEPVDDYGFISVAMGDGVVELFKDLGCSYVVSGGQTMNPSTEEILKAINATPAKVVYVFPNNKNILLSAEQTIPMVNDRKVVVIPTRTIPQGLSALMAFNPDIEIQENIENMKKAAKKVATGQVTFAARESEYGGFKIKGGDILCLKNGKLIAIEKDPIRACYKLLKSMVKGSSSFVTLIYGNGISEEQASQVKDIMSKSRFKGHHLDISLVNGGQPVYYFILSVE